MRRMQHRVGQNATLPINTGHDDCGRVQQPVSSTSRSAYGMTTLTHFSIRLNHSGGGNTIYHHPCKQLRHNFSHIGDDTTTLQNVTTIVVKTDAKTEGCTKHDTRTTRVRNIPTCQTAGMTIMVSVTHDGEGRKTRVRTTTPTPRSHFSEGRR